MGLLKSIKHAVKKVSKAVAGSAKTSVQAVTNPVKFTKNLIKDPVGTIAKTLGLDKLYSAPSIKNAATEEQQPSPTNEEEQPTAQDRSRMLSRQSGQGAIPLMLLGQDFNADAVNLDESVELGGKGQ